MTQETCQFLKFWNSTKYGRDIVFFPIFISLVLRNPREFYFVNPREQKKVCYTFLLIASLILMIIQGVPRELWLFMYPFSQPIFDLQGWYITHFVEKGLTFMKIKRHFQITLQKYSYLSPKLSVRFWLKKCVKFYKTQNLKFDL